MSSKQKILHGLGPFNLNLGIFVCSFDVRQASTSLLLPMFQRLKRYRCIEAINEAVAKKSYSTGKVLFYPHRSLAVCQFLVFWFV